MSIRAESYRGNTLIHYQHTLSAYINKGLIIPCTSPCNTPILLVKKPNGKGWRFIQDLKSINAIVFLTTILPPAV